jgi:putative phosphoesterase
VKIAILSDIHSNIVALEAVLEDLSQVGGADQIVVPGDMFAYGPAPRQTLEKLHDLPNAHFLMGNTDRYLLQGDYPAIFSGDGWRHKLMLSFEWTAQQLGAEGLCFLEGLPLCQVIQAGSHDLLAVHGSPRSDEEGLSLETADAALHGVSLGPQVAVLVCGHTHIPMNYVLNGMRVVNAGSVGIPFDGIPRACYALISDLSTGSARAELRRVIYDVEAAVAQYYDRQHPAAEMSAYNLRMARSVGGSQVYNHATHREQALVAQVERG